MSLTITKINFLAFSRTAIAKVRQDHKVTRNQLETLAAIMSHDIAPTYSQIADTLLMSRQSLYEAIWGFEAKGMIRVEKVIGHRKTYHITDDGHKALDGYCIAMMDLVDRHSFL